MPVVVSARDAALEGPLFHGSDCAEQPMRGRSDGKISAEQIFTTLDESVETYFRQNFTGG
jgi:hypothetical protein